MKRLVFVSYVIAGLLIAGYVFASGQSESSSSSSGQPVKLSFWTPHTPPYSVALKQMVDTYNKEHPGVVVTMTQVPGSSTDAAKMITAVRAGTAPDSYELDRFSVIQWAAVGALENLQPYITKSAPGLGSDYMPFAWAETQWRGNTYALPSTTDARALFYRDASLRSIGVDPSIFDPKNGPLTIAEIKQISDKFTKTDSNGNYTQIGIIPYDTKFNAGGPYTWGFDFGGKFMDYGACKVTPTDPGVVKAFQFAYDWAKQMGPQKVQTFLSTYVPPNNPPEQDPFLIGKVAMEISGPWALTSLKKYGPNLKYGVTYLPVPQKGDKPSTWAGGWSFVLPKGAKHPAQAFDFIRWMAGPQGQKIYAIGTTKLPTYNSLTSDSSIYTGNLSFFKTILTFAKSRPNIPVGALYYNALLAAWGDVTSNQATPEQALQGVAQKVQPQLQRYCPLK